MCMKRIKIQDAHKVNDVLELQLISKLFSSQIHTSNIITTTTVWKEAGREARHGCIHRCKQYGIFEIIQHMIVNV